MESGSGDCVGVGRNVVGLYWISMLYLFICLKRHRDLEWLVCLWGLLCVWVCCVCVLSMCVCVCFVGVCVCVLLVCVCVCPVCVCVCVVCVCEGVVCRECRRADGVCRFVRQGCGAERAGRR